MHSAEPGNSSVIHEEPNPSTDRLSPKGETALRERVSQKLGFCVSTAGAAFLCAWLVVNRSLFVHPVLESGDAATILLQVSNAEHFHEMLGNYSRWVFHHPGPGFMYLLAMGDAVFRDLLHIVPAPWNSAALTLLVLYTCSLFATIFLFQQHSRSRWFVPAAVAASLWFIYVVNRTFPGSASGQIWMPHILLYSFLLFVAACASLATGKGRHLPLVVFCGGLCIHGHVAQCLFVGALILPACLVWLFPQVRKGGFAVAIKRNRTPLLISLGIVLLFAFPIVLEAALHHPNNLHNLKLYLRHHRGPQNTWLTCLEYLCSFLTFIPDTEVVLKNPEPHLISLAVARPYVLAYWGMFAVLIVASLVTSLSKRARMSAFLRYVIFELLLVSLLITYWARKIAGPLFAFNAHFYFATFLLASFVLIAFLADAWLPDGIHGWSLAASCVLPFLMLAVPGQFRALQSGADLHWEPEVRAIVANLPNDGKRVFLVWPDHNDWGIAMGVASWLREQQRPFCVANDQSFHFTNLEECRDIAGVETVEIARPPFSCAAPCRVIFQNAEIVAALSPFAQHALPFQLLTDGPDLLPTDFNGVEAVAHGPMWSTRHSAVHFLLSEHWNPTPTVRVIVKGVVWPGRPAVLSLNGHVLGTLSQQGLVTAEFKVPESVFRAGASNELSFSVDHAGPVGDDYRTLGFQLWGVQVLPDSGQ
jgi:hypothetical protein